MKKFLKAATAAVLAASLMGCSVNAEDNSSSTKEDDNKTEDTSSGTSSAKSLSYSSDETGKEETVYVFTDAAGVQNKLIVSDKLHVAGKSGDIKDKSDLKDIVNVSGDETFTQNGDDITWQSEGTDISYQGTSDKELPVSVKVTYYLNDKEVSPEEISGASGHVRIRYDYTNNSSEQVVVNGTSETVKVPFAMVTGLVLNDSFSNVTVQNGKMLQYENNSIVYGIAFPGLKDSLDLESNKNVDLSNWDIPEYVEVEGDTTNFGIDMAMTYASSNLLNDLVGDDNDIDLSDISDKVDELDSAAVQLNDGTKSLKNGTAQLKSGAAQLAAGASSAYNGASTLSSGLGQLSANSSSLNAGAAQIAQGVLDTANQQLKANDLTKNLPALTLENYATVLGSVIGVDQLRAAALKQIEAAAGQDEATTRALIYMAAIHSTGNFTNDLAAQGRRAQQAQAVKQAVAGYTGKESALKSQSVQAVLAAYKQQILNGNVPEPTDEEKNQIYAGIAQTVRQAADGALNDLSDDQVNAITAYALSQSSSSNVSTAVLKQALTKLLPALQNQQQAAVILNTDYKTSTAYQALASQQFAAAYKQQVNAMNNSALYDQIAAAVSIQTGITDEAEISKLIGYTCDHYQTLAGNDLTAKLMAAGSTLTDASQVAAEIANSTTAAGQEKINGALDVQVNSNAAAAKGKEQLSSLESSLDGISAFVEGLKAYTAGVDKAYAGSRQLVSGLNSLNSGAASLASGASELDSGAETLMTGMQQFYDEGISQITDIFGGGLSDAFERTKAVFDSGTSYTSYGGALDDPNNTVRFIFRTDTINADDSTK